MEAKNPSEALAKDNGKNSSKGQAQFGLNIFFTRCPFIHIVLPNKCKHPSESQIEPRISNYFLNYVVFIKRNICLTEKVNKEGTLPAKGHCQMQW